MVSISYELETYDRSLKINNGDPCFTRPGLKRHFQSSMECSPIIDEIEIQSGRVI